MAAFACISVFLGTASTADARQTITINGATFGATALSCYSIGLHFAAACNGKHSCRIACNDRSSGCGDPAPHRPKSCWVWYTCSAQPGRQLMRAFSDRTKPHHLRCP